MNRLFPVLTLICCVMFVGAGAACADTLQFTLAGPVSASFELASSPFVMAGNVSSGAGFMMAAPPDLVVNGTAAANDFLVFYNSSKLGGLGIFVTPSNPAVHVTGLQLYSGPESNPTFSTGMFSLIGFPNGGGPFTLTVTDISTVSAPEPSVVVLLFIGLAVVGLTLLRFKPNFSVQAS